MLATASDKGTVVRVFSVPDARKLWQFRRGSSHAKIWSINFNLASSLLGVSSDSSTIHIYRLAGKNGSGQHLPSLPSTSEMGNGTGGHEDLRSPTPSETPSSPPLGATIPTPSATSSLRRRSYHIGKSFVGGVGGYLPRSVSEMWEPQRDFAFVKIRGGTGKNVVAMSS